MNVLIGDNAAGKTAILEAIAISLGGYLAALPTMSSRHMQKGDVLQYVHEHEGLTTYESQFPARVGAKGFFQGKLIQWERTLNSPRGRTTRGSAWGSKARALIAAVKKGEALELPLVAYYGTQRVWLQKRATHAKRNAGSRYDGYVDALDPASNHRLMEEWIYQQTLIELQQGQKSVHLAAIEAAVCRGVGARRFFFNLKYGCLELHLPEDEICPFDQLSDGYRNMVAMVADLAWRACVLNPHWGGEAAERTTGIVLIDEVDLHLHPHWQRRVLSELKASFPRLQFVVTTHSPQVLASARRAEVRLLENGTLVPTPFVEGRDTNSLLREAFSSEERPRDAEAQIQELAQLIERNDYSKAHKQLAVLESKVGPDDPAVVRAMLELEMEQGDAAL